MKLSRISRIVQLLTSLQSGQSYSAEALAEQVGVSRRTVFRDLQELGTIGVPFYFDVQAGGYRIDPEYFLAPVDLNLQEALSLLLLVHEGRNHLAIPFKNSALLAGLKIENNLPGQIREYCNATLQNISIRADRHRPMERLDKIFAQFQTAIHTKHKVKVEYESVFEGECITTTLNPYHLMYNRRAWYLMGHSSLHKSIRTFKLARMKTVKVLKGRFVNKGKFDLYEYLGRAWSMIPEGRIYNIRLRFSSRVARNVAEVQWHSTQKAEFNDDGSLTVKFRVDGLGEISWWILGYGDQVEVLAPVVLRKKVARRASKMAKLNGA